jgi:hypothetical protein
MKDYTKEALNLAARISMELGENLDVQDFAHAISIILKAEYGRHNFELFNNTLNQYLNGN